MTLCMAAFISGTLSKLTSAAEVPFVESRRRRLLEFEVGESITFGSMFSSPTTSTDWSVDAGPLRGFPFE
jgi:hypothetical protein